MLSHLRFHRRNPSSNPTSPVPDRDREQFGLWDPASHLPQASQQDLSPVVLDNGPQSARLPAVPPLLPPIARVTSTESEPSFDQRDFDLRSPITAPSPAPAPIRQQESRPSARQPYNEEKGFIGGVALRNYRQMQQAQSRQDMPPPPLPQSSSPRNAPSRSALPETQLSRPKPPPPPINIGVANRPSMPTKDKKPVSSFVTPTDLQQGSGAAATPTGKRPAGTRLVSEPAMSGTPTEAPKAKKSLPFLKNPMSSLLMRRKVNQNAPDVVPLPLSPRHEEPVYDPRIKGTRVHDFSAPRAPRRAVPHERAAAGQTMMKHEAPQVTEKRSQYSMSSSHESAKVPPLHVSKPDQSGSVTSESLAASSVETDSMRRPGLSHDSSVQTRESARRPSLDKALPDQPAPPVPPKADAQSGPSPSATSRAPSVASASAPRASPSNRTNGSRNLSVSDVSARDIVSGLPKHMKSTSSRFSFDMIGAAKAEKLLEERHRQKELEKKTSEPERGPADSRYDEFDEDAFEYDNMDYDDGLEEAIPGVNCDADEDDFEAAMDPDNDQENFAGFVFQRSGPESALTSPNSPGILDTPRDAHGNVIGFAMGKETPDLDTVLRSPLGPTEQKQEQTIKEGAVESMTGLGICGMDVPDQQNAEPTSQQSQQQTSPQENRNDDLYFDEGLADELDFDGDRVPFDESLFDLDDTDQYGRPIPGAFAQAQAKVMAERAAKKRESDLTSRLSAQSRVSQSTAHTSLSLEQQLHSQQEKEKKCESTSPKQEALATLDETEVTGQEKIAAYQAALAEAAHKAAASGKFRRGSSPPLPAEPVVISPTTASDSKSPPDDDPLAGYEDEDPFEYDMNDYDLDDDAIIAEANASALANDMDDFYGQEFGFYPAPAQQSHYAYSGASNHGGTKTTGYEYSNGGYFGPSGLGRSKSGHVVSREPNLTPITERSEYSNRNSIMSLAVPGPASASLQSPGLAQLAMMADDDNMSLSALLKLRSRAWGGSQASAMSSRDGSPRSDLGDASPWGGLPGAGPGTGQGGGAGFASVSTAAAPSTGAHHARKNSTLSMRSRESDDDTESGSPTLTMSIPLAAIPASGSANPPFASPPTTFSPPPPPPMSCPPVLEDEELPSSATESMAPFPWTASAGMSPLAEAVAQQQQQASQRRPGVGHRHKGSADSVSYVKEEDSGETRWVVERRRTAESGEVEVLRREVLQGVRI